MNHQETTHDKDRGRVDYGATTENSVTFHTPFPRVPCVMVNGPYFVMAVSRTGFSLDRIPDVPVVWVAQQIACIVFDIDDVRRILELDASHEPARGRLPDPLTDDGEVVAW